MPRSGWKGAQQKELDDLIAWAKREAEKQRQEEKDRLNAIAKLIRTVPTDGDKREAA